MRYTSSILFVSAIMNTLCRSSARRGSLAFGNLASVTTNRASSIRIPQSWRYHHDDRSSGIAHRCRVFPASRPRPSSSIRTNSLASASSVDADNVFFSQDHADFASLGIQSPVLLERIEALGLRRPTAVQAAAYRDISAAEGDVMVGAETGTGKTLAYLLPLLDDILQRKANAADTNTSLGYDYARAIILVPNKELVQQVVRMAVSLSGGRQSLVYGGSALPDAANLPPTDDATLAKDTVRLAILPGGLRELQDFQPFRKAIGLGGSEPPVDLVISTPAALGVLGLKPANIDMFGDIRTLVVDEADMLLDGGYIRPLENVLMGFRRADRLDPTLGVPRTQHVFVAATLPDFGTRSVDAYLKKKFPYVSQVTMAGMHNARHYGLREQTLWMEEESKKTRMEKLVELFGTPVTEGGLQDEKVMVFLNSVDDVEGANQALQRAGLKVLPYHAKVSLDERTATLDRFRRYDPKSPDGEGTVPILVCSDLAARGIDVPGVNTVVQLQFAGNVVAHLHRMGRCGRAGQRTGRGIVFYDAKERELVEVVQQAEIQQNRMVLPGDVIELAGDEQDGSVKNAFSRKRGFSKKRKKLRKEADSSSDEAIEIT
jgi:superfamily II DNA/RNA helicase